MMWIRRNVLVGILLLVLVLILSVPALTWQRWHQCNDEANLRLVVASVTTNAYGQIIAQGDVLSGGQYRADRYRVIVYAKDDIWYNNLKSQPQKAAETSLRSDCSWQINGLHPGTIYAAYLVHPDFQQSLTIATIDTTTLPFISEQNDKIVAFGWWQEPETAVSNTITGQAALWLLNQRAPNQFLQNPLSQHIGLLMSYADIPAPSEPFPIPFSRAYVPDNALASIALLTEENVLAATQILTTLQSKVENDGQINFYFDTDNAIFHPIYRSDAIAWAGYAFVFYQLKTGDTQFQATAEKIAMYLLSLQETNKQSTSYGSIRRNNQTDGGEHFAADNIVAYFFLRDLATVTNQPHITVAAERIQRSLLNQYWKDQLGYFEPVLAQTNDKFIESHTLGMLFLMANREMEKANRLLQHIEENYRPTGVGQPYDGFAPFPELETVWSPASMQMALIYHRVHQTSKSDALIAQQLRLQVDSPGILYAYPEALTTPAGSYYSRPSVAGTAWLIIASNNNLLFFR